MITKVSLGLTISGLLLLFIAACGGQAYINLAEEYDRESETFLKGITDRDDVKICYAKRETTPILISEMATAECQRFGKIARFREQSLQTCPLISPISAVFDCLDPAQRSKGNFR